MIDCLLYTSMSESFFYDDRFKEEKKRFLDKTEIVSDSVFKSMSDTQTPQGCLLYTSQRQLTRHVDGSIHSWLSLHSFSTRPLMRM